MRNNHQFLIVWIILCNTLFKLVTSIASNSNDNVPIVKYVSQQCGMICINWLVFHLNHFLHENTLCNPEEDPTKRTIVHANWQHLLTIFIQASNFLWLKPRLHLSNKWNRLLMDWDFFPQSFANYIYSNFFTPMSPLQKHHVQHPKGEHPILQSG